MVVELMGWDFLFSSMAYGSWWKRHRAVFQKYFSPTGGEARYNETQLSETHAFLRNLLETPDDFRHLTRRLAAAIILKITYGLDVDEEVVDDHNYISLANAALRGLSTAGIFGTYLVDYLPALKYIPAWLPGASFKRQAIKWRKVTQDLVRRPFELVRHKMQYGTATPCLVTQELENILLSAGDKEQETVLRNSAATTYAAGSDTVVSSILSFFLTMALFPDIQDKAQKELDTVLGGRLPTHADRSQLPYINCICYEVLRWQPVTNLAVAHYASEDDEYQGYRIPRGTTVLPNVWAILHDPNHYPEPLSFKPERFLDTQKNMAEGINQLPDAAFGFGRRMCPGRGFAADTLWIVVASVLSVYRISRALDESGKPLDPVVAYTSGLISHPQPFPCRIVPRSAAARALINQTLDERV